MKKSLALLGSLAAGILNGILGVGGGIIMVPVLKKAGLPEKQAHATSICIVLPMCIVSSALYLKNKDVTLMQALPYAVYALPGTLIGVFVFSRINKVMLTRILAIFILFCGIRLLLR